MSRVNRSRSIFILIVAILIFLSGYFSDQVNSFFLDKNTQIGFMLVLCAFLISWIVYLKMQALKREYYNDQQREEINDLREIKYQHLNFTDALTETKREILEAITKQHDKDLKEAQKSKERSDMAKLIKRGFKTFEKIIKPFGK